MKDKVMFNLSNHPSTKWNGAQAEAAAEFEVVDFAFPNVDASATTEEVRKLATDFFTNLKNQWREKYMGKKLYIHVMGEMGFVYNFVDAAKREDFICVHSTTERVVKENEDGTKTSTFEFKQFRKY
jgi:hypothetical protein